MSSAKNKVRLDRTIAGLLISIFLIAFVSSAGAQELQLATETPTPAVTEENPFAKVASHRQPIPLRWKIAIVLAAVAIGSISLWGSMRVWRASNLFDRQYHFPQLETAALRLGANRSGGRMATISFSDRAGPIRPQHSGGKNV